MPQSKSSAPKRTSKSQKTKEKNSSTSQGKEELPDTVYAATTKKQHGWFSPLVTLTKEQVTHNYSSIRFTNRNAKGHWCKMETINNSGELVATNDFSPYILKLNSVDTDSLANQEWAEKLKTSCIFELVTDPTGETVIQERAYDKDRNIVYIYSRTPIGKDKNGRNRFIGSYKDSYGMPAEMRNDSLYTYGTLVRLTEDQWGNDSIIEYLDAKGIRKLNSEGVAMEVFICNKEGELIKQQSRDSLGNLTIDNCGNCGIKYTYNTDHTIASATYMDASWKPMRMPDYRQSGAESVIQTKYAYDENKRYIEAAYFTADDKPDKNAHGAHRITLSYNNAGGEIARHFYDTEDNLTNCKDGYARDTVYYDTCNRIKEIHWYDAKGHYVVSADNLSRLRFDYDDKGEQILDERYCCGKDNTEYLVFKKEKRPNYEHTQWSDGTSRIDSLDAKGRTTFIGFYGKDKRPEMTNGHAFEKYTYQDSWKTTISIGVNYDENGEKVDVNGVCKTITKIDSISWTMTKWRYDASDVLKETFIHRYTPNFKTVIGQDDANTFGTISRSGGSSEVRYYKGCIMYNKKNEFTSLYGRDEFGETDYITSSNVLYCYSKMFSSTGTKFYDEDNNAIDNFYNLRNSLPKVMTIEVVDSAAYAHGLRDNDVILLYGDYAANLDTITTYSDFITGWTLRSVIDARKNKRMVVFRIEDASKGKFGLVEIKNLVGTPSELGFLAHVRYLTKKQRARIQQAISDDIASTSPLVTRETLTKPNNDGGNNYVIICCPEMYRSIRNAAYPKQITDPSILLGVCSEGRNLKWTIEDGDDLDNYNAIFLSREQEASTYSPIYFLFAKSTDKITPLTLNDKYLRGSMWIAYISDEEMKQLAPLYTQAKEDIYRRCDTKTTHPKRFVGYWKIQNSETDQYPVTGYLDLSKNGQVEGEITNYGYRQYSEGLAIFKVTNSYSGTWSSDNKWLYLPINKDYEETTLECIDLIGADDGLKQRALAYMNGICNDNKKSMLSKMTFLNPNIGSDLRINALADKAFIVNDSISFIKAKRPNTSITEKAKPLTEGIVATTESTTNNSPKLIVGRWQTTIPNVKSSNVLLDLLESGVSDMSLWVVLRQPYNDDITVNVRLSVYLHGKWSANEDSLTLYNDPSATSITTDLDIDGNLGEVQKAELKKQLLNEFEEQKNQIMMSMLQQNAFEGTFAVTSLDSTTLAFNGNTYRRVQDSQDVLYGEVGNLNGLMREKGYTGSYFILEWCDWNCTNTVNDFSTEFSKQRNNSKHLILLPVEFINNSPVFKDIIETEFPAGQLGFRVMDYNASDELRNEITQRYFNWKISHSNSR